jgi:hypothetical protein
MTLITLASAVHRFFDCEVPRRLRDSRDGSLGEDYATRPSTTHALMPPKPNELLIT